MKEGKENKLLSRGRYDLKFRGTTCLNCNHIIDIDDKYCSNCSQANSIKKLTLKDFFDEFFFNLINYDSKLLATLYTMLIKPGTITKDYINGKRIRYTNPFRFLLTLAFIYFLMVNYNDSFTDLDSLKLDEKIDESELISFSDDENDTNAFNFDKKPTLKDILKKELDSLEKINPEAAEKTKILDSLSYYIAQKDIEEKKMDSLMTHDPVSYFKKIQKDPGNRFFNKMNFFFSTLKKDSISTYDDAVTKYKIDQSLNTKFAFNASKSALRAWNQPGSWLKDTISRLPFVIFFFLPIFTIFIYVAYIRKKHTYTDHLIFSFHSQSLLFILLILSWVLDSIFNWMTTDIFLLIFGIYLFQAMRKFYNQGFFKTSIKYIFLSFVFTFLAIITVLLLGIGSIFTY